MLKYKIMQQPTISKEQAWENVKKYADRLGYGRINLVIKDGMPVMGEVPMQGVKFDQPDNGEEFKTRPVL